MRDLTDDEIDHVAGGPGVGGNGSGGGGTSGGGTGL